MEFLWTTTMTLFSKRILQKKLTICLLFDNGYLTECWMVLVGLIFVFIHRVLSKLSVIGGNIQCIIQTGFNYALLTLISQIFHTNFQPIVGYITVKLFSFYFSRTNFATKIWKNSMRCMQKSRLFSDFSFMTFLVIFF